MAHSTRRDSGDTIDLPPILRTTRNERFSGPFLVEPLAIVCPGQPHGSRSLKRRLDQFCDAHGPSCHLARKLPASQNTPGHA